MAKKVAKKAASKAKATKAAKVAPKKRDRSPVSKAMTKSEVYAVIAENTGLAKKDVGAVFGELGEIIERHINRKAIGQFIMPGLLKIRCIKRPARPARRGVPNPFKPGELMDIPAKPASMKVKVTPLKKLKELVQ